MAGVDGGLEGGFVDQATAGAVDDECTLVHERKAVGIENVVGVRRHRDVEGDDVGSGEGFIGRGGETDLHFIGAGLGEEGVIGDNLHVEGLGALGELGSDAAHADDGEGFTVEFDALEGFTGGFEITGNDSGVAEGDVAGGGTHESEGVLGGGNGVSGGRVHHNHAVGIGGITIDVVDADAGAANSLEPGGGGEDLGGDLGLGANDESIVFADDFQQFVGREPDLEISGDVRMGIEKLNTDFRNRVGDQNATWHSRGAVTHGRDERKCGVVLR